MARNVRERAVSRELKEVGMGRGLKVWEVVVVAFAVTVSFPVTPFKIGFADGWGAVGRAEGAETGAAHELLGGAWGLRAG